MQHDPNIVEAWQGLVRVLEKQPGRSADAVKQAQAFNLALQLWGSIFVLAFIGVVGVLGVMVLERRLLRWHHSQLLTPP